MLYWLRDAQIGCDIDKNLTYTTNYLPAKTTILPIWKSILPARGGTNNQYYHTGGQPLLKHNQYIIISIVIQSVVVLDLRRFHHLLLPFEL